MAYHISELSIRGSAFEHFFVGESGKLGRLSKVNLFVGPNNSGKSRFMRGLAEMTDIEFEPSQDLRALASICEELPHRIQEVCYQNNIEDVGAASAKALELRPPSTVTEGKEILENVRSLLDSLTAQGPLTLRMRGGSTDRGPHAKIRSSLQEIGHEYRERLSTVAKNVTESYKFKRIYIPTLRGLRCYGELDIYEERTKKDYFESSGNVEIFTGLKLYSEIRKLLLGTFVERRAAASFEQFLSDSFFEGCPVALIPKHDGDVIEVKIGDEPQLPIHKLGDGIQSIIILTFPLFRDKGENLLVFFEEPELFLHPGMQRVFLNALLRPEFDNAQYFAATHSNHLLDLTLDIESISIFTFKKEMEFGESPERPAKVTIENVSNEDERSLQLLGIQNSSVFLSNCTIWVEGITDRRYFTHYINMYQEYLSKSTEFQGTTFIKFKQDLHFSFVEYAGANITHFSFLDAHADAIVVNRLCAKLFLISDKDGEANRAKHERQESLKASLQERYYCLQCREVENLLTPEVLRAVLTAMEGDESDIPSFEQIHYNEEPLAKFIEETVLCGQPKRSYRTMRNGRKSDALADKVGFCQRALENIKSFDDLSVEAQELTIRLYKFISSMN